MEPIKPTEIKIGMVLTGIDSIPYSNGVKDRSFHGDLVEVLAVDLPYIIVRYIDRWSEWKTKVDTRVFTMAVPSVEYIETLRPSKSDSSEIN